MAHSCRTAFRKAQLSARRSLEAAQKLERSLLLASYTASANVSPSSSTILSSDTTSNAQNAADTTSSTSQTGTLHDNASITTTAADFRDKLFPPSSRRRHRNHNNNNADLNQQQHSDLVATSSDVTLALRRTHALIAGEVAKSAFAAQTLAESSAALAELQRSYEGASGMLARSRDLVASLVTQQKSDTWYLRAALRLLLATLAWLVFRRLLYGPLWWLVWLPLRTGFRVGKGVTGSLSSAGGTRAGGGDGDSGGEVGRMEVRGPGGASFVGVGEEGAVPTVAVGREAEAKGDDADSMVERIGRMVEDTLDQVEKRESESNRTGESAEAGDEPNPMKRMWEEDEVVGGEAEPIRDEL